jgi:hypothetical protein
LTSDRDRAVVDRAVAVRKVGVEKVVGAQMVRRREKPVGQKVDADAVRTTARHREIEVPAGHAAAKGEVLATEVLAIGGRMVRHDLRVQSGSSIGLMRTRTAR